MVDAVMTWVDGSDPAHARKRADALAGLTPETIDRLEQDALSTTRFDDRNEVYYSVHLLRRNAPWLDRIFLVTDDQRPGWLTAEVARDLNVEVVDHRVIFAGFEHALPTFNSMAINTMIHRIPGLSQTHILLNDDFFVIRPTRSDDYFSGDRPRLRGRVIRRGLLGNLRNRIDLAGDSRASTGLLGFRLGAEGKLRDAAYKVQLYHTPYPLHTARYADLLSDRTDANIGHRFRNARQFEPVSLYANEEFNAGKVDIVPSDLAYFSPGTDDVLTPDVIRARTAAEDVLHVCFQNLDQFDERSQAAAFAYLDACLEGEI